MAGLAVVGFSQKPPDFFEAWKSPIGMPGGKEMWTLAFLAVIWSIWKERNARCFEGVAVNGASLIVKITFTIAYWVSINCVFHGYTLDQVMFIWKEVALSFAGS